jgi:lactoylglutathione lyase
MFRQVDYVMIVVSDMSKSVAFYRDKLGLPLKFESPEWTEFQTGATILALHGGGIAKNPANREDSSKAAGTCSIGFNVENLDKTYTDLKEKGIFFVLPPTQREGEGIRLAVCVDPDGLPVSFAQNIS